MNCVLLTMHACTIYAKQKHPRCKTSMGKSEVPVSSYSNIKLKSLISGGGQAQAVWQAAMY